MRLGLYIGQLGLRGTDQFVYQLADICQTILHHQVIIITQQNQKRESDVTEASQAMFRSHFFVVFIAEHEALDEIAIRYRLEAMYVSKWGIPDGLVTKRIPCIVHAIFECATPHGHCYAAISNHMQQKCRAECHVLPFCVELLPMKNDLRKMHNIPIDAVVFGRHGGYDTFDIPFVQQAVVDLAKDKTEVFFLFMNTKRFTADRDNIIFLEGNSELQARSDFVHACDAMIHGRNDGETFGLACGEFSLANKPIITTDKGDQAHVSILQPNVYVAQSREQVYLFLQKIANKETLNCLSRYDAYKKFDRAYVAGIFEKLLQAAVRLFLQQSFEEVAS